jgi:hypothetical protein
MENRSLIFWVEPVSGRSRDGMIFTKPTLEEATAWVSQAYVRGHYRVVSRHPSKVPACKHCNHIEPGDLAARYPVPTSKCQTCGDMGWKMRNAREYEFHTCPACGLSHPDNTPKNAKDLMTPLLESES